MKRTKRINHKTCNWLGPNHFSNKVEECTGTKNFDKETMQNIERRKVCQVDNNHDGEFSLKSTEPKQVNKCINL